jgi:hypothetical protein
MPELLERLSSAAALLSPLHLQAKQAELEEQLAAVQAELAVRLPGQRPSAL